MDQECSRKTCFHNHLQPREKDLSKIGSQSVPPIYDGFNDAVGHTPMIVLKSFSDATQCNILAKAEHMNPGGSVKDRAAKFMIEEAERSGKLKPGGLIIEATAGFCVYLLIIEKSCSVCFYLTF